MEVNMINKTKNEEVVVEVKKTVSLDPKHKKLIAVGILILAILSVGFLGGVFAVKLENKIKEKVEDVSKFVSVVEQSATIDVVKKVSPSVVSITSEQSTLNFFGQIQKSKSAGTGFLVTADGLIMTNKHVVSAEGGTYSVFTSDGKEYKAEVKALDTSFDLAFLKIDGKGLTPVELGDSDKLQVGQNVIAIGNALGQYQNTVTTGVVSAVGRAIQAGDGTGVQETLENLIQTDAAINPGNSGGPLSNIDGQVIGINTAVDQSGEGIGFAIPINLAKTALDSVLKTGKISRPYLGIRYMNITKEFATRNNLSVDHGALIYSSGSDLAVLPNSPASKAGLKSGDIITKIDDMELVQGKSLINVLSNFKVGDKVTVYFIRDGKEAKTEATLAEAKS
jgi:serine protease Do